MHHFEIQSESFVAHLVVMQTQHIYALIHAWQTASSVMSAGLFLPASAFKSVRRAAADQLLALRQQHHYAQDLAQHQVLPQLLSEAAAAAAVKPSTVSANDTSMPNSTHVGRVDQYHTSQQQRHNTNKPSSNIRTTRSPQLRVLCRAPGQVQAALEVPWLEEVIVDFLEVHGLKEAVAAVRAAGKRVVVALPRILKPGGRGMEVSRVFDRSRILHA